jgi:uncharacterized RDD family membrane protein YckC
MEIKTKMKKIHRIWAVVLGVVLLASSVQAADETEPANGDLFVAGSKEQVYLIEQLMTGDGPMLQVGIRQKQSKEMLWQPVIGRLQGAVTIEDQLFLSFEDGTLMRYDGMYVFPQVPSNGQTEQMVVDARRDRLYVLASHDVFSDPSINGTSTKPASAPAKKAAAADDATKDSTWAVYQLVSGKWKYCCSLPNDLGINAQPMLIVENECMDLFVRPDPFSDKLYHWGYGKDVWVAQPLIELPKDSKRVWAMSIRGVQALVISRAVEDGEVLDLYHLVDDKLEKIVTLGVDEKTPLVLKGKYAISESPDQSMMVAYTTPKDGTVAVSQWSPYGQLLGDVDTVTLTGRDSKYESSTWMMLALSLVLLVVVLTRKNNDPQELAIPMTMAIAPFWRRGAAFMIDFMPAVILSMIIWDDYFSQMKHTASLLEYLREVQHDQKMLMINFFVYGVYIVYSVVTEGVWGRTLGKRVMGLEVRELRDMSQRPRWVAVIWRNVLKVIELGTPLILVMFFTRNRQRIGDMIGRTIVLHKGK